jgi:hypothetical protein
MFIYRSSEPSEIENLKALIKSRLCEDCLSLTINDETIFLGGIQPDRPIKDAIQDELVRSALISAPDSLLRILKNRLGYIRIINLDVNSTCVSLEIRFDPVDNIFTIIY